MKVHVNVLVIISMMFLLMFIEPALSASVNKETDKANYSILGLIVGESTGYEVQSKFGFALAFGDDNDPEAQQMCLISDRDETLFRIRIKHNRLIRLRLQSDKKLFHKWHFCTKSPLVSKYTATARGIKLGMSKTDLKAIIGPPEEESNDRMKYIWQKSTKKANAHRNQQIELRANFLDDKLESIDLVWQMH